VTGAFTFDARAVRASVLAEKRSTPATLATAATDEIEPIVSVAESQVSQTTIRQNQPKQAGSVARIASVAGVAPDPAAQEHAEDQAKRVCDTCDFATIHLDPANLDERAAFMEHDAGMPRRWAAYLAQLS
jgi:hypothetical protein